jgi:hypothetical protein
MPVLGTGQSVSSQIAAIAQQKVELDGEFAKFKDDMEATMRLAIKAAAQLVCDGTHCDSTGCVAI